MPGALRAFDYRQIRTFCQPGNAPPSIWWQAKQLPLPLATASCLPCSTRLANPETDPATPNAAPPAAGLAISHIEPKSALYGSREVTITVHGSGFGPDSVIVFQGNSYSASVNPEGTQLVVTLPARDLAMGRYAVTVSNGGGRRAR